KLFSRLSAQRRPALFRPRETIHLSRVLRCARRQRKRTTGETCLQSREHAEFSDAGVFHVGRGKVPACSSEWTAHGARAELRDGWMGTQRSLCGAGKRAVSG